MSFNNVHGWLRQVDSASHAWIALHRLVELYGRTTGVSFHSVFEDLERRFDFRRCDVERRPELATIREMGDWLRSARDAFLATRQALTTAQRAAKAHGQPYQIAGALLELEARVRRNTAQIPYVGCWGWRKRREGWRFDI